MIDNNVSLDLMEFVERNILPRYNAFDKAHNLAHANSVIRSSIQLARRFGADVNMSYVIAAYHDLGLEGPRAVHHITSGKILATDRRLQKWFSSAQLNVMKEAVEDHRASSDHTPRSLYGRIVAEADRFIDPVTITQRTIQYGLDHYPELSHEEQYQRMVTHLKEKYGRNGYLKLWFPDSPNAQRLEQLRKMIDDDHCLAQLFEDYFKNH
jgi:uncharacterized protein